jgi:hypothetical protein
MSLQIRCYTLFDITKTGVTNRRNSTNLDPKWQKQRNTQCNFDTILQVASLRSQPENVTDPVLSTVIFSEFDKFGFLFENETEPHPCWSFDFTVNFHSVFDDGIHEFGHLYADCDGVPMIPIGTEWDKLPTFIDASPELRNIYFEVLPDEAN